MPASVHSDDSESRRKAAQHSDGDGGDRIIDGLRFPRPERQIDQFGFELTTHSLHFHGRDWDIPLTQKRDELTKAFMQDAAEATNEPEENIRNLRFIVTPTHLDAKFTVRHKVHVSKYRVQKMLSSAKWTLVKALYEPRQKMQRPSKPVKACAGHSGAQDDQPMLGSNRRTPSHNLSFFGRANVGAEGPEFEDHADDGEEPVSYEHQVNARTQRTTSGLFISVGFAA
ncbi:conserved hypothetical protein [Leishmania mexicana MHOM/GT/2001/U1103]|uniref:Flagellar attachment zone protein 1 conserved domain-containing protein n=1 Tax=Leishmania mexicana (strain MHOM/GT/2001/U1103) TaxID=929439 RepID=E9AYH9_LEIMU|nr:conserved hypothetical protein [Leishmania mexicana MHOM/GT/2001/U1103]CBZ28021.1 conserved hypothetical protein [Leishmania mexicana MHOM/GT/2001/U1103]